MLAAVRKGWNSLPKPHHMLLAFVSVLLLPIMAAAQSATPASHAAPGFAPCPSLLSSCFGQSPLGTILVESIFPAGSFGFDTCAQQMPIAIELHRAGGSATTTSTGLPEAPSSKSGVSSSTDSARDASGRRFMFPALDVQQSTDRTWHTFDRRFILLQTLSTMALVADLETTAHVVAGKPKAIELDPLFGEHPTRVRLYGIGVPLDAVTFYLSYHSKKSAPKRRLWEVGPGLSTAVHTAAAINNFILLSNR